MSYAQAQVVNPQIGVNFSKLNSDNVALSQDGVRAGLNAGVNFRVGGDEGRVFFQPGIHYYRISSQFKAQTVDGDNTGGVNTQLRDVVNVHSLKVPMDVGVYLTNRESPVKVRVSAGGTPSFVLAVGKNDIVTSDDFKKVYLGLNGGVGFDFSIVTLDFNYEHPLSKVVDSVKGLDASGINGTARYFNINLGIVI